VFLGFGFVWVLDGAAPAKPSNKTDSFSPNDAPNLVCLALSVA